MFVFLMNLHFSGGQKSRVAFAKITFKKPHIILLDEPSNHLVSVCKSPVLTLQHELRQHGCDIPASIMIGKRYYVYT